MIVLFFEGMYGQKLRKKMYTFLELIVSAKHWPKLLLKDEKRNKYEVLYVVL